MHIEGKIIRLRAVEPDDIDLLYVWENDAAVWPVSGTTEPFSREQMARFVERQLCGGDLLHTGQLRLIIELPVPDKSVVAGKPVGAVDLFEFDPINRRAGVGILIHTCDDRGRGYASDAIAALCRYARETLGMHQLWCNVGSDNEASLRLFRSAGFTVIGTKRQWQWHPGGYRDEAMMQKILE